MKLQRTLTQRTQSSNLVSMNNLIDIINEYTRDEPLPINVADLAIKIGLSMNLDSFEGKDISGFLKRGENGEFGITINSQDHPNRQRFTIAHEIGHYILHHHLIGEGIFDNRAFRASGNQHKNPSITQQQETEANRFAASILMPYERLQDAYTELGASPPTEEQLINLSKSWGVSLQAMKIRLKPFLPPL